MKRTRREIRKEYARDTPFYAFEIMRCNTDDETKISALNSSFKRAAALCFEAILEDIAESGKGMYQTPMVGSIAIKLINDKWDFKVVMRVVLKKSFKSPMATFQSIVSYVKEAFGLK